MNTSPRIADRRIKPPRVKLIPSTNIAGSATRQEPAINITNPGSVRLFVSVVRRRDDQIIIRSSNPVIRTLRAKSSIISAYPKLGRSRGQDDDDEIVVAFSSDRNKLRAALQTTGTSRSRADDASWSVVRVPRSPRTTRQSARGQSSRGTVRWFNADKGFGFIAPDDGTADVFVHFSAIQPGGFRSLQENQRVEYTATEGSPAAASAGAWDLEGGERQVYGLLECPDVVVVDREFELAVGLTETPDNEALSDAMTLFPEDTVVDVLVVAPGCILRSGETWLQSLPISADEQFPAVTLHLTVPSNERYRPARMIKAVYSVPGRTLGLAVRSVAVVRTESEVEGVVPTELGRTATVAPPTGPRNDLEIIIQQFPQDPPGVLRWHYISTNPHVARHEELIQTRIGNEPRRFAEYLLEMIDGKAKDVDIAEVILGFGGIIAEKIPKQVWAALRTVAAAAPPGEVPTVLILSDEPFVPWELALIDPPLWPESQDGRNVPPILGAQVCIGRWVLADQRPHTPPPSELIFGQMAVVSGRYERRIRIKEAEREAMELRKKYGAADVAAELTAVRKCLRGQPLSQAIHFALHGRYSSGDAAKDGILLVDGKILGPVAVSGYRLDRQDHSRPLVFLNACQVGTGDALLGTYAGMGAAFLTAGAAAVVAPLWSVDDGQARAIALRFYEQVLEKGLSPAEFFRSLRAGFQPDGDEVAVTPLAYQFFGHPQLKIIGHPQLKIIGREEVRPL